jgi:uncharacterized protein (DUF1330 family)
MPKAYVVARVTVTDPEAYAEYVKGASQAIRQYGGRPLARGGAYEALEGEARAQRHSRIRITRTGEALLSFTGVSGRESQARRRCHSGDRRDRRRRVTG